MPFPDSVLRLELRLLVGGPWDGRLATSYWDGFELNRHVPPAPFAGMVMGLDDPRQRAVRTQRGFYRPAERHGFMLYWRGWIR